MCSGAYFLTATMAGVNSSAHWYFGEMAKIRKINIAADQLPSVFGIIYNLIESVLQSDKSVFGKKISFSSQKGEVRSGPMLWHVSIWGCHCEDLQQLLHRFSPPPGHWQVPCIIMGWALPENRLESVPSDKGTRDWSGVWGLQHVTVWRIFVPATLKRTRETWWD